MKVDFQDLAYKITQHVMFGKGLLRYDNQHKKWDQRHTITQKNE